MTDCPECWKAETPWRQRVLAGVVDHLLSPRPNAAMTAIASAASVYSIMLGAGPEPTWYEKHRDRWVKTGDVAELTRMTRHV
jgi:hypothetical protein